MAEVTTKGYLSSLVDDTLNGDSNAFAVLFVATYEDLFTKCYVALRDEYAAQDVLFHTYTLAYKDLHWIQNSDAFLSWIDAINSGQLVRVLRKRGNTRVAPIDFESSLFKIRKKLCRTTMSLETAGQLLESIFYELDLNANDVSLETLASYHQYRSNRFTFQWVIIGLALLALILIPLYFIEPKFTLTMNEAESSPKNALYKVKIDGFLPISTVTAKVDGTAVSVMLDDSREYTVSSTINGKLDVKVTLINTKFTTKSDTITIIDRIKPTISSYQKEGDHVVIYTEDVGYGVDFEKIVAVKQNGGDILYPISYDEASGRVVFPYDALPIQIAIPDKAENTYQVILTPTR